MFSWSHFFMGFAAVGLGFLMVKFSFQIVGYTGRQDWIESKLGSGSTYFAYKMIGVFTIIGGFLYAGGLMDSVLGWLLSPLINVIAPGN